jgi:hypothetical protein
MLNVEHLQLAENGLSAAQEAVLHAIDEGIPASQVALLLLSVAQLHASIAAARAEMGLADEVCQVKLALREVTELGRLKVEVT